MQISLASYQELSRSLSQRDLYQLSLSIRSLDVHRFSTVPSALGLHKNLESASFNRVLNHGTDKVDSRMIPVDLVKCISSIIQRCVQIDCRMLALVFSKRPCAEP